MFNCNVHFYLVGCPEEFSAAIEAMAPLPHFRHTFVKTPQLEKDKVWGADVIFMNAACGEKDIRAVLAAKKPDAEFILLGGAEVFLPEDILKPLRDIWTLPIDGEMARFRFARWQEQYHKKLELWQTGQYLDCLMQATPNMVWFKSKDGAHELVSDSFCRTVNKTLEQVRGRHHAYIWNVEADDPACIESERIVMATGKRHVAEEEIDTGSGKRLLKTIKYPLHDFDGSMMGTMGIGIDITKERDYQKTILKNNAAMETIFTSMDCGILYHNLAGDRVIGVNDAALRLLGFSSLKDLEEDFVMVASTVVEEDQVFLRKEFASLKNLGDCANYTYRVRHRDGSIAHVMCNARLVEKDGELVFQRFLLDCTQQKLAEERRQYEKERKQKRLIRALCIDFQLVCVFETDEDDGTVLQLMDSPDPNLKKIFTCNKSLAEKFEDYIQKCVYVEDRAACSELFNLDKLREKLRNDNTFYFVYRIMDGQQARYFQLKAVRVGQANASFGVVIGLQGVDARVRSEIEQKNRLEAALKDAKKASRAKSLFLSNMSHDIRTPMNAIIGYTSLALNHLERKKQVIDYLNKIRGSSEHLISLINDILDMSLIESGKIQLDEKKWNLEEILDELWNIVQPTADAKAQKLTLNISGVRNRVIQCDKLRLNQVLLNLLNNAVKYTPAGGRIEMEVTQYPTGTEGCACYEFRIIDNGIGMTQEFLERIFEPFERARTSTVAGIQGTGLGMAIAKSLVTMMNGDIRVRSEVDVGTEFTLTVAFRVDEEDEAKAGDRSHSYAGGNEKKYMVIPTARHVCRILLAEDNPMNQEIACEFLRGAGFEVDVAVNGKEAVEMLAKAGPGHYGVVLMDVQMPVMDGYEATSRIRALENKALADIPIIAMTANSFEEDRKRALAHGMNKHIAKPIDFNILFDTLDEMLAKS